MVPRGKATKLIALVVVLAVVECAILLWASYAENDPEPRVLAYPVVEVDAAVAQWRSTLEAEGASYLEGFDLILVGEVVQLGESPGIWAGGVMPTFQPVYYRVIEVIRGRFHDDGIWAGHLLASTRPGVRKLDPPGLEADYYAPGRRFILQLRLEWGGVVGHYVFREWGTGSGDAVPATPENTAFLRSILEK